MRYKSRTKTILVVEDDEDMQSLYLDMLANDYKVILADDVEDAKKSLRTEKIDLMLLDIILPKKSGDEFLREIIKSNEFGKIKVIVITVLGDITYLLKKIDPNVACLSKPFDKKVLLAMINEKLEE